MNIAEILKDCPKGTRLYSPLFGEVTLSEIKADNVFRIIVYDDNGVVRTFTEDGKAYFNYNDAECVLFPSKENRDWSTFKIPKKEYKFKPFDKVLVRDSDDKVWQIDFFAYTSISNYKYQAMTGAWKQCIPYKGNEHLLGKIENPA